MKSKNLLLSIIILLVILSSASVIASNDKIYFDQKSGITYTINDDGSFNVISLNEEKKEKQGLTLSLALVIIGVMALIGFVFWVSYKDSSKDEKKKINEPITTALLLGLFSIILVLFLEAIDTLPDGWAKEHYWVFLLIMVSVFFWTNQHNQKYKPLPLPRLEKLLWNFIHIRYKKGPHVGDGFGSPLPYHNIIESKQKGVFNKIIYFLARINARGGMFVLIGMDLGNGYIVKHVESPDQNYVKRLFGKEAAQQYDIERELLGKNVIGDNGEETPETD